MKFININWLSIDWIKTGLLRRLNYLGRIFSPFISTEVKLRLRSIRRRHHGSSSSLFV